MDLTLQQKQALFNYDGVDSVRGTSIQNVKNCVLFPVNGTNLNIVGGNPITLTNEVDLLRSVNVSSVVGSNSTMTYDSDTLTTHIIRTAQDDTNRTWVPYVGLSLDANKTYRVSFRATNVGAETFEINYIGGETNNYLNDSLQSGDTAVYTHIGRPHQTYNTIRLAIRGSSWDVFEVTMQLLEVVEITEPTINGQFGLQKSIQPFNKNLLKCTNQDYALTTIPLSTDSRAYIFPINFGKLTEAKQFGYLNGVTENLYIKADVNNSLEIGIFDSVLNTGPNFIVDDQFLIISIEITGDKCSVYVNFHYDSVMDFSGTTLLISDIDFALGAITDGTDITDNFNCIVGYPVVVDGFTSVLDRRERFNELYRTYNFKETALATHAGYTLGYPRNCISNYVAMVERGVFNLEVDVQQTTDGEWICFHDTDVDADTTGIGNVAGLSLDEIKGLRYTQLTNTHIENEQIPTLSEVFDWAKNDARINLMLNLKTSTGILDLFSIVNSGFNLSRVEFQTSFESEIQLLRDNCADCKIIYLKTNGFNNSNVDFMATIGGAICTPHAEVFASIASYEYAVDREVPVYAYGLMASNNANEPIISRLACLKLGKIYLDLPYRHGSTLDHGWHRPFPSKNYDQAEFDETDLPPENMGRAGTVFHIINDTGVSEAAVSRMGSINKRDFVDNEDMWVKLIFSNVVGTVELNTLYFGSHAQSINNQSIPLLENKITTVLARVRNAHAYSNLYCKITLDDGSRADMQYVGFKPWVEGDSPTHIITSE